MRARIFQPPKTAMQSGWAGTAEWRLAYDSGAGRRPDPLMGWSGGSDTQNQVVLRFPTKEDAIAYAEREGIPYEVEIPHARVMRVKAYADNFKFGRPENWTH
jgi:hypothetical protein